MSNYAEDYIRAPDDEKLLMLQDIYKTATSEEKVIILKEIQRLYNKLKGRYHKEYIMKEVVK